MSQVVEVKLWGVTVGRMGYVDSSNVAVFEYDDAIIDSSVNISPIHMPNSIERFQFHDISQRTFKGLPGVFADSLPDTFGNQLIDLYMAEKGIPNESITALDRLLYIGNRGMGALEYHPTENLDNGVPANTALDIQLLSELAAKVVDRNNERHESILAASDTKTAIKLIRVGSSAGGARTKALVATSPKGDFLDGTYDHGADHRYWLMKFDSEGNRDRDNFDPKGMTKVEYIYGKLAAEAGIDMPTVDFIEENGDFHFMIERFDRVKGDGKMDKLHYASWCGLEHAHRDQTGAYSYSQLVMLARKLKLPQKSVEEIFRRAVFNVLGTNQDDHTKNFGFTFNKQGEWSLSPAFDVTYAYDPNGKWTRTHQIKLNGKGDDFSYSDLVAFGEYCNLSSIQVREITQQVSDCISRFGGMAKELNIGKSLFNTVVSCQRIKSVKAPTPSCKVTSEKVEPESLSHKLKP